METFFRRETLQQLLHANNRVIDDPVYLCDLGASMSTAGPSDLQEIVQESNVGFSFTI